MNRLSLAYGGMIACMLTLGAVIAGARDEPASFLPFSKGERWCAVGDSITHVGGYHKYIYLYYATRFLEARFDLDNCGVGGATARQTLARMETDVVPHDPTAATVMLGMNDVWWENKGDLKLDDYVHDMGAIIDRLRQRNCRVMVMTTSPYDANVKSDSVIDPKREGLERFAGAARKVAAEKKIPCLDLFALLKTLTAKRQATDPSFSLMNTDRTHPKDTGYFVMAYYFLKHQDVPAVVSRVELNAAITGLVAFENCIVDKLEFGERAISFSLLEKSLPFPVSSIPQGAESLVPFGQDFNREILKIAGLPPGSYEVLIDGAGIGVFSEKMLFGGVNLSSIDATPQNRQAKSVADLITKRHDIVSGKLRYIAMIEYGELKRFYAKEEAFIARTDILARLEAIEDSKKREEEKRKFDQYLDLKRQQVKLEKEAQSYDDQMWAVNRPVWHNFTIRPKSSGRSQ